MQEDVIFRYKNGRIIPIKVKQEQTTNDYMNDKIRNTNKNGKVNEQEDKTYQLTDEQIQRVIEESISKWDDNYAGLYITKMNPRKFLELTTSRNYMKVIEEHKFDLDIEQVKSKQRVADMMYLDIDLETGQIRGHEGRHRALAFDNAGYKQVDVVVFPYNYDKYNAKEYNNFELKAQTDDAIINDYVFDDDKKVMLEKLVPVSKNNIERVKRRNY